jgi:hypothetical protein
MAGVGRVADRALEQAVNPQVPGLPVEADRAESVQGVQRLVEIVAADRPVESFPAVAGHGVGREYAERFWARPLTQVARPG